MIFVALHGNQDVGKTAIADYLAKRHGFFVARLESSSTIKFEIALDCIRIVRGAEWPGAVVDSIHTDHHAKFIRAHGAQLWIVVKPQRNAPPFAGINQDGRDRGLLNDGSLERLHERVDLLLRQLESIS